VNIFFLQCDESTDVEGLAVLLVFVRYLFNDNVQEDMLLCKPLPNHTTGAEIFKVVDTFFTENELQNSPSVMIYVLMVRKV
jgi:hypothetical protein